MAVFVAGCSLSLLSDLVFSEAFERLQGCWHEYCSYLFVPFVFMWPPGLKLANFWQGIKLHKLILVLDYVPDSVKAWIGCRCSLPSDWIPFASLLHWLQTVVRPVNMFSWHSSSISSLSEWAEITLGEDSFAGLQSGSACGWDCWWPDWP